MCAWIESISSAELGASHRLELRAPPFPSLRRDPGQTERASIGLAEVVGESRVHGAFERRASGSRELASMACYDSAMHCRSLALATSLIALNAALACENERPLADDLLRIDAGDQQPAGGGAGGEGSMDASVPEPAAPTDASVAEEPPPDASGPSSCEQADQTFRDFLAANRSCSVSSDCTTIGDCGPNADFAAIDVAAAAMGYALMEARCPGQFDGPTFAAVCQDGQCMLGPENGCCGCPSDAGVDGG